MQNHTEFIMLTGCIYKTFKLHIQIMFLEPLLENHHLVLDTSKNENKMKYTLKLKDLYQPGTGTSSRDNLISKVNYWF